MSTAQQVGRSADRALSVVGGVLALMWGLELIDTLTGHALDPWGIKPRSAAGLPFIVTAPFLHFGWAHLIANSIPFLVLGVLIFLEGRRAWVIVSVLSALTSGVTVWLLSPTHSNTAGASGVVFGYLTYLLVRGFYTRRLGQIVVAVAVFAIYGSILWGVLPIAYGVSWQGHLGGAIGGVLAAAAMHGEARRTRAATRG